MRKLIIGGSAIFLLVAVAPAHINTDGLRHTETYSCAPPQYTLKNGLTDNNRGGAFARYHPEAAQQRKDTSLNGQWFLQPALPADTATGEFPSLHFNLKKKTFSGNTGCNTMNGSFVITDSSFHFNDNLRVTRKVCTGYNEAAFLKNLLMANRYTITDSVMTLWFNQTELSRWTRKPDRELKIKKA